MADGQLYVDRVMQSPVAIPYTTELDDDLSIFRLDQLFESQRTMQGRVRRTYVRSVTDKADRTDQPSIALSSKWKGP